jgi:hypothetical protein
MFNMNTLTAEGCLWHRSALRRLVISFLAVVIAVGLALSLVMHVSGQNQTVQSNGIGPDTVTIDHSEPFDKVSGYTYVEATMHGVVERDDGSQGEYSVPVVLIHPEGDGNNVGVVDLTNSVFYPGTGFTVDDPNSTLMLIRQATDGYMFENGYTYLALQWNKEVTDFFEGDEEATEENHFASGSIEQTSDAWTIIRDAAGFLRDPESYLENDAVGNGEIPNAVDTVLSSGYSQSGIQLNTFVFEGHNEFNGELAYDGHLVGTGGFTCTSPLDSADLDDLGGYRWESGPCDADATPPDDGSKAIAIMTEATVQFIATPRFEEEPEHWRQYELAGVAHTNPAITPDGPLILSDDRNRVVHIPVFRAALHNLTQWVTDGVEPPPSRFLEGELVDDFPMFELELDEHGHAIGGLRLPHMEREVNGAPAGAPLGIYTSLNPEYLGYWMEEPSFDAFAGVLTSITGTFEPFDEAEMQERYPNHGTYANRVARAALALYQDGYILAEDRRAYVQDAAHSSGYVQGESLRR